MRRHRSRSLSGRVCKGVASATKARVRLTGQVRPTSYENDKDQTRYVVEFVVGPFGDLEVLARGKVREQVATA